ncbi:MAG: sigma-70 family RNA polymerase sigma factor [Acidobacteria bacterium]|nr:sigma-70 family RNA polymerase sigma factor [Acidobacteriota bacterium]
MTRQDIAPLLAGTAAGEEEAAARLFAIVYDELRRLAASALRRERADHTLQPTALVHEAFLRLVDVPEEQWHDRGHFVALAARAMRRVLVDHARGRNTLKRGKADLRVPFEGVDVAAGEPTGVDLVALDTVLERLAALDPRQARIVELRFFGGLTVDETAALIGTSTRTIKRDWQMARAWLRRELARIDDDA